MHYACDCMCMCVCVQFVFGVSEWELFHTLTSGATAVVCGDDIVHNPAALASEMAPCAVAFLVPSLLGMVLPSLRTVQRPWRLRHDHRW